MRDTRRYVARSPEQVWAEAVVWYLQMPPHHLTLPEKVRLAHILGWEHYVPLCPRCTPPPIPNRRGSERTERKTAWLTATPA